MRMCMTLDPDVDPQTSEVSVFSAVAIPFPHILLENSTRQLRFDFRVPHTHCAFLFYYSGGLETETLAQRDTTHAPHARVPRYLPGWRSPSYRRREMVRPYMPDEGRQATNT